LPERPIQNSGANGGDGPRKGVARFGAQRIDEPRQDAEDRNWPTIARKRPASKAKRIFLALIALILLGGLAASAYSLKLWLGSDARFRIHGASSIQASGLSEVSRAEMLPVFAEDVGRNIFSLPLNKRRKQLEEIPWVERATVMRLLPDQIRVTIVERKPVAFARQGSEFGLVDANGVLLTMPAAMMAQHHYSFPVVSGIDANASLAARKARMDVYQRLLTELDAGGQHISAQISEIDLTDPSDARVLMPEQGGDVLAHFGQDQFLERYQRYKAHIVDWRRQYPKLSGVDLRYEEQVVLQMTAGNNVAQATADEQAAARVDAEQNKPSTANPSADKPVVQTGTKLAGSVAAKPKTAAAKEKAVKDKAAKDKAAKAKTAAVKAREKKRAAAQRAALNVNRHATAPASHPVENSAKGL